jgi:hypothetical protein
MKKPSTTADGSHEKANGLILKIVVLKVDRTSRIYSRGTLKVELIDKLAGSQSGCEG